MSHTLIPRPHFPNCRLSRAGVVWLAFLSLHLPLADRFRKLTLCFSTDLAFTLLEHGTCDRVHRIVSEKPSVLLHMGFSVTL